MDMKFKRLTQAEKNKIRRKAIEALTVENWGDCADNFHENATAQAVISLLDELAAYKADYDTLKSGVAIQRHHIDTLKELQPVLTSQPIGWTDETELRDLENTGIGNVFAYDDNKVFDPRRQVPVFLSTNVANVKQPEPWRAFVTDDDVASLIRFADCCDDPDSGGHDLEPEQVARLVNIGALNQIRNNYHETTHFGNFLISVGIKDAKYARFAHSNLC